MANLTSADRIRGSLLGGAIGDALGAPIEFMSLANIWAHFGPSGLRDYAPAYGRLGAVTDDTQMTLFTAEGVMRAWVRAGERGICEPAGVIHHAYFRWLLTQGERPARENTIGTDGWLFATPALHNRRAPGATCVGALREATGIYSPPMAQNNSKGCGGLMRVAPIGLFASEIGDNERVFSMAMDTAALTHGHPTGYLAAGYFAVVLAALCRGEKMHRALREADAALLDKDQNGEVRCAVDAARSLTAAGRPTPEDLESLGGGWVAEEALAIAVCCASVAEDFADGVLLAINHSGDSDSTGSITGNLLGAQLGAATIPAAWLDGVELRHQIEHLAADLDNICSGRLTSAAAWEDYPGW